VKIAFEEMHLSFNDGVNVRYFDYGEKLPAKHQLHIEFDDFSSLILSVQMYGGILLSDNEEEFGEYYQMAKTKVSPLCAENTPEYFFGLMDSVKQNYSTKAFLATEQRFPGLGNGVLQDILFNAGVNPRRKLQTLTDAEKENLYHSVKKTILEMTIGGGRNTEKDLFGCVGGYQTKLSAKTKTRPCPDCGDYIVREAFMGGHVYFCPTCQPYEK
jgi:formamidopyrimidine-DNA glycosylase